MNSISEQILNAIDLVTEEKLSRLRYDKTVKAEVYSLVDADTGEYKVRYQGTIFSVYSEDLNTLYEVGDSVFIKVPEGDFSNRKTIAGLVSGSSLSAIQLTELANTITEISPSFSEFYGYKTEPGEDEEWGVVAGATEPSAGSELLLTNPPYPYSSLVAHDRFQQYSNKYEYIRIQASFLTAFHQVHTTGNYGLEVEFYTTDEDSTVRYILDLNNFTGDPYSLSVYSPQSVIVKAQKNYLHGLKSIRLFEEGFEYDVSPFEEEVTTPNIFVKDINLQYVEKLDLSDTTYYLTISPLDGNSFTDETSSLRFQGSLVYQGKNVLNDSTCVCSWFKRDLSVSPGSTGYDKDVGFGWAPIESSTKETISSDGSSLTISKDAVIYQEEYKLKVVYNSRVTTTAAIEVFNLTNPQSYHLEQITTEDNIELQLINDKFSEELTGEWYYSYPDGTYLTFDEGVKHPSIPVSGLLLYSAVDFYVTVYQEDKKLGTLSYSLVNSESEDDLILNYIGEDNFRYDANGDVTIVDSEKDRTLTTSLTWKDGVGTHYAVEWFIKDPSNNSEIAVPTSYAERFNPSLSMLEGVWLDKTKNILHYHIKQKYKTNYLNNSLIIKIITLDEQTYTFEKEILFLKDGDQGTNGTTYVACVRPADSAGSKLSGFQALRYRDGQWVDNMNLRCYTYRDGEIITSGQGGYTIEYRWEGINVSVTENESDKSRVVVSAQAGAPASIERYIKVQITITDNINGNSNVIYTHYPIDVVVDSSNVTVDTSLVDMSNIPSYIKYTSTGVIPSTSSDSLSFEYDGKVYKNTDDKVIESLNRKLLKIEDKEDDGEWSSYLNPATSFIFEQSGDTTIGLLSCRISSTQQLLHSIVMYLDTYGNEAINGWDGTYIPTEDGYLFAPQVGAGEKDSSNLFTGVVMGKDSGQSMIGLYGYQKGVNTFGLQQDGTAYFGAKNAGGRIVLDGRHAYIYGGDTTVDSQGNIKYAANGMALTLADKTDKGTDSNTVAIAIGKQDGQNKGVFEVNYSGALTATKATINGAIYAESGRIGGTAREGGWIIETNRLYSGSGNSQVELNSGTVQTPTLSVSSSGISRNNNALTNDYARIWAGGSSPTTAKFFITQSGVVYMNDAYISGAINSKSGQIGGWTISSKGLYSTKVGMSNGTSSSAIGSSLAFWVGSNVTTNDNGSYSSGSLEDSSSQASKENVYFYVTTSGKLYCRQAEVQGKISSTSGNIGGWEINSSGLQYKDSDGNVTAYLRSNGGAKFGDGFSVTSVGKLVASGAEISGKVTASSGTIGGWTISSSYLTAGETYLSSNGHISCSYLQADISGSIGGWNISSSSLAKGNTILSSTNGITTNTVTIKEGTTTYGYVGKVQSWNDDSYYLGIKSTTDKVVVESTASDVALRTNANDAHVWIQSSKGDVSIIGKNIHFTGNVTGIHATFA